MKVLPTLRRPKKPNLTPEQGLAALDRLRAYVTTRATLSTEEIAFMLSLFRPRRLAKGEVVQQAGDPPREMIFVARGCLRSYVIDEKGNLHVVSFAPEDWWVSDTARFVGGEPSGLFIDAIEASDVLLIDHASHQRIVDTVPAFGAAYRAALQRLAAARDRRIISALTASAQDRYLDFAARYPTLLGRVPLRMLASYLGMSPETLSRIRKNLSRKPVS